MKKYQIFLAVLLLAVLPNASLPQCYTVLSVKGEIISEKTGQPIKEMDEICATDKLKFSTKDSKAAVLSSEQGRFVVKVSGKNTSNELIAFVSSVLFAGKERLSTKIMLFDDEQISLNNFKSEFGASYFIINESRVYADTSVYKLNEQNYFSIKYLYDGNEIEKKLKFEKNCMVIGKDVLEGLNPDNIEFVSIYYNNIGNKESKKLASFKLSFLEEQKIKDVLSGYTSILKKAGKDDYYIVEQSQFLLSDLYGNVNYYDLSTYLENNLGIKGY